MTNYGGVNSSQTDRPGANSKIKSDLRVEEN